MPLPVKLWGLDPLFCSYRKLSVQTIDSLVEKNDGKNDEGLWEFYLFGRPVVKVEVLGRVRSIDTRKRSKVILGVQDQSSDRLIECKKWYDSDSNEALPLRDFQLGDVVAVRGVLVITRSPDDESALEFGIQVHEAAHLLDEYEEALFEARRELLLNTVYRQSFVCPVLSSQTQLLLDLIQVGCACSVSAQVKERLLFCQCTSFSVFNRCAEVTPFTLASNHGLAQSAHSLVVTSEDLSFLASEVLKYFLNRYESALEEEQPLCLTEEQILNDHYLLKQSTVLFDRITSPLDQYAAQQRAVAAANQVECSTIREGRPDETNTPAHTLLRAVCSALSEDGILLPAFPSLLSRDSHVKPRPKQLMLATVEHVLQPLLESCRSKVGGSSAGIGALPPWLSKALSTTLPGVPQWRWLFLNNQLEDEVGSWNRD